MADKLLTYLRDEFERMDVDHKARVQGFEKHYKQFRGILPEDATAHKSRLFINKTKSAIYTGLANIIDILFPTTEFFDVAGRTEMDQQGAAIIKKLAIWLVALGGFAQEAIKYVLQAAIYGTTFAKIIKERKVEVSVDKLPIPNFLRQVIGYKTGMSKKVVEFPAIKTVSVFDVWIDPPATGINDASGLFHRSYRTLNYLKEREAEGLYKNIDQVERYIDTKRSDEDKRRRSTGLPILDRAPETVALYEYHGLVGREEAQDAGIEALENEYEIEIIATMVEKDVIIRAERNTFPGSARMWISDVWEQAGDESIYGRGIPENSRGSQMALNTTVNLRLDNKAWAIAMPLLVNIDEIEDPNDLIARPNWIIRTNGKPSDIAQFADIPDVTQGAYQEAEYFSSIIEEESGMKPEVQGGPFGSNRTASGISLAFSAATRPLRLIARGFEQNLITKGLKLLYTYFLAELDREIVVRLLDDPTAPEFLRVDPSSLSLDIDFIPTGTFALVSRENAAGMITDFASAISQIAGAAPQVVQQINWEYMVKKFYESMFGLKDWDKVWMKGGVGLAAGLGGQESPTATAEGEPAGQPDLAGLIESLGGPQGGGQ